MAAEVFLDTSGFFALMDELDPSHERAVRWMKRHQGRTYLISSEWVVGETCTLLVARKKPYLVSKFLDHVERSSALLLVNPDSSLLASAKTLIRQQASQGYSFVDCLSFCVMRERSIREGLTRDEHFRKAGFIPLLG